MDTQKRFNSTTKMGDKAGHLPTFVTQSLYSGVYLSFISIMHHVCPAEDKLHSVWQWSAVYIRCTVWARVCVRTGRNILTENPVLAGWLTLSWHVGPSHCSHMTTQQNSAHARTHAHTLCIELTESSSRSSRPPIMLCRVTDEEWGG